MEAQRRAAVEHAIEMMHGVKAPEQRYLVIGTVPPIDPEIEQHQVEDEPAGTAPPCGPPGQGVRRTLRDSLARLGLVRPTLRQVAGAVGIAVGYATLGRIGYEGRHDYGAIGNVTILASRLSSQATRNAICSY